MLKVGKTKGWQDGLHCRGQAPHCSPAGESQAPRPARRSECDQGRPAHRQASLRVERGIEIGHPAVERIADYPQHRRGNARARRGGQDGVRFHVHHIGPQPGERLPFVFARRHARRCDAGRAVERNRALLKDSGDRLRHWFRTREGTARTREETLIIKNQAFRLDGGSQSSA